MRSARFGFRQPEDDRPVVAPQNVTPRISTWRKWTVRILMFAFWWICVILILSQGR